MVGLTDSPLLCGRHLRVPQGRIALASSAELPELTADDAALRLAIEDLGLEAVPVVWDAEGIEWSGFDGCLIRSVWDYHLKHDRFLCWVEAVAAQTRLWNPPEIVSWNSSKTYLRELAREGVPTVPTVWVPRGSRMLLRELGEGRGWKDVVLKPTVDLGATGLVRVRADDPASQRSLDRMAAKQEVMVQPYFRSLEARGELSLFWIAGKWTHAVRKLPAAGEKSHDELVALVLDAKARLERDGHARSSLGQPPSLAGLGEL